MLKQTKIVFEIKEIAAFSIECDKCESKVSHSILTYAPLPKKCPICKEDWFDAASQLVSDFRNALRNLALQDKTNMKAWLELNENLTYAPYKRNSKTG